MPIMDGPATLALLRESVTTADIPVVFMTARAQSREIELFRSLGAAAVIQKPFDPMKLAASVRTHIDFMDVQLRALNNDFRARLDQDASALARHQAALDDGTAEPGTRRKSGTSHIDWPEPAVSSISKKSAAPPRQLRMPLFSVLMPLTRATGSSPLLIVCSPRLKWLANCETGRLRWRLRVGLNSPRRRWGGAFKALLVLIWFIAPLSPAHAQRFDGVNVVVGAGSSLRQRLRRRALANTALGASAIAIIPFLWQRTVRVPLTSCAATTCRMRVARRDPGCARARLRGGGEAACLGSRELGRRGRHGRGRLAPLVTR